MKKALVITSIAPDTNPVLNTYAKECKDRGVEFIVIGDTKSPDKFKLEGCDYWGVERQRLLTLNLSDRTPYGHYSRKNLGYLVAIKNGCHQIQETDDDNIPYESFWSDKSRKLMCPLAVETGWTNVYSYFTNEFIWARGFPLEELKKPKAELVPTWISHCPIQQGLADGNPDVDAIYRLIGKLPLDFERTTFSLALGKNAWHPFNSQNTYWFKEAFPLLYLPSYCSFRMTDIWRSYVAQRIAWECGWSIYYHGATVFQERNEHNLMSDFSQEVVGYLNNSTICKELQALKLKEGKENIYDNLVACYQKLIDIRVIEKEEIALLEAWIEDLKVIG